MTNPPQIRAKPRKVRQLEHCEICDKPFMPSTDARLCCSEECREEKLNRYWNKARDPGYYSELRKVQPQSCLSGGTVPPRRKSMERWNENN